MINAAIQQQRRRFELVISLDIIGKIDSSKTKAAWQLKWQRAHNFLNKRIQCAQASNNS